MEFEGTELQLKQEDFKEDVETCQHLKVLLNSALGKFNQKNSHIHSKFLRSTEDFEKLFKEGAEIIDINDISDFICQVNIKSNVCVRNKKTNPIILAFITARARVDLHSHIKNLVAQQFVPFYCDTDSILFSGPTKRKVPLPFSLAFGDFKHELGENTTIKKFESYGKKNFSIAYESGNERKMLMKVSGLSLQSKLMQEEMVRIFEDRRKCPKIPQIRQLFEKKFSIALPSVQQISFNNVDVRCERKISSKCPNLSTKPWGY